MKATADYDQLRRDPRSRKFYNSAAWKRCRAGKLAETPWCEWVADGSDGPCGNPAEHVHHVEPIATAAGWADRLNRAKLLAVCVACHNRAEAAGPPVPVLPGVGTLHLAEDETYLYDPDAAERPIRFIARYCRHYEGRFAGQPFDPLPWQRDVIRTLFGWRRRADGLRRFRELYMLTAKGAGKTPMLAALGLYLLLADGEAGPHVISMASTFEQANLTFGGGKGYLSESAELSRHAQSMQFVIRGRRHGKWTTVSGKPNGRSGPRPSAIIADEMHEWEGRTGEAYDVLCANLFKRSQPMLLTATNAGSNRTCFAWQLHERALRVLAGQVRDDSLLPVIYEAPAALAWDGEEAAKAANPSMGTIVQFEQLASQLGKARMNAAAQANYERLYLSRWVQGASRWIDVAERWTPNVLADDRPPADAPLYVGLDLSQGDDLSAAVFVRVSPDRMWVDAHFWVPKDTAAKYEARDAIPYRKWADAGNITLLDDLTINGEVRKRIAREVLARGKPLAVCFDRYKADEAVAELEAGGIKCVPVAQGYTLAPGVAELDRRLKERTIAIAPNGVLTWNAENAELKQDDRGNQWPVKPNAKGTYAGRRSAKIDGITALVTALTQARSHHWPAASKKWTGMVDVI